MAGIGIGVIWVSYSALLWGYCLFKGYNVSVKQLMSPTWPPAAPKPAPSGGGGTPPKAQ